MKATYLLKTTALFLFVFALSPAFASSDPPAADRATTARVLLLETRLAEIKTIDKAALSKADKKSLRHEVREIKKELAVMNGGVYLSAGAIILIALLLILLL